MNRNKYKHIMVSLAISALLLIGADEVQWKYVYVPLVMKRYP